MMRGLWIVLLALLVLAPLPFGGFRPWAWSLAGVVIAMLGAGWIALAAAGRTAFFWRGALWPPLGLFACIILWIVVQNAWPADAPTAHPMWQLAAQALGTPVTGHIGATPAESRAHLLRLLSSALTFWLVLQGSRDRDRAIELVRCCGIASALYALYGLVDLIAGNRYLLVYPRWAYPDDVTGTFVNRNTFATFAGLGLLALCTLLADGYRRAARDADPTLDRLARAQAALAGWPAVYLCTALIDAMALLQSHSRMGLVAALAGLAALLLALRVAGSIRGWTPPIVAGALGIGVFCASGSGVGARIASGEGSDRAALIATTQRAIASSPWLGSGYGSFRDVFPLYRDTTLPAPVTYEMAHNTYLELAMELGVPAAVALVATMLWLTVLAAAGVVRRERDRSLPALAVAAAVLIGVHSLLEFSVQITAVQLIFVSLLAMGVAQSYPSGERLSRFAAGGADLSEVRADA